MHGTAIRPGGILASRRPAGGAIHFEIGVALEIAGMPVRPGDIVVGDNDGAIVIPPDGLEVVVRAAESILATEDELFIALERDGLTYREFVARRSR